MELNDTFFLKINFTLKQLQQKILIFSLEIGFWLQKYEKLHCEKFKIEIKILQKMKIQIKKKKKIVNLFLETQQQNYFLFNRIKVRR